MKKYLTTTEVCEKLNIHRNTLKRWRDQGLPYHKVNRSIRFDMDEVSDWVKGTSQYNDNEKEQRKELLIPIFAIEKGLEKIKELYADMATRAKVIGIFGDNKDIESINELQKRYEKYLEEMSKNILSNMSTFLEFEKEFKKFK